MSGDRRQLAVTDNYEVSSIGKNIKRVGEKLKVKEVLGVGSRVNVIGGTHKGLAGKVVAVSKGSRDLGMGQKELDGEIYCSVELKINGTIVQVRRKRLVLKEQATRERSRSREHETQRPENCDDGEKHRSMKRLKWVTEGLILRVISKKVHDGKLYDKLVKITTIFDKYSFEAIPLDEDQKGHDVVSITDLREKDLETVLPTRTEIEHGERIQVLIVYGKYKGQTAKVISIDKKRDRVVV